MFVPAVVKLGAVALYVPLLVVLYVTLAPLLGTLTLTFAQLWALPLYVRLLLDALTVIAFLSIVHV